jgi:hypothetical protein
MRDYLWAYCVAGVDASLPAGMAGVSAAHPVERVEAAGLAALVSRVPRDEFASAPLQANLNDLGWLERVARRHVAVLDRALAATIVPLRLCTIFDGADSVRGMLAQRQTILREALATLSGREEWGVKLIVDRAALEHAAGGDADDAPAQGSGVAYLQRRRRDRDRRETADRLAAELAADVHARVRAVAHACVLNPAQRRELSGHAGEMLLNGAYLVDAAEVDRLQGVLADVEAVHRELGARVQLIGPFPPFNFAMPA